MRDYAGKNGRAASPKIPRDKRHSTRLSRSYFGRFVAVNSGASISKLEFEVLGQYPRRRQHRHEVCVAIPSRHDVAMHMLGDSCARAAAEIGAHIEARGIQRFAQLHATFGNQLRDDAALFSRKQFRRGHMAARRHHQVPVVVGITVEHHHRISALIYDEAALALVGIELTETEDAGIGLGTRAADVLISPRRP